MYIRLPRWLARFNRFGTNRIMGLWAPYVPPWAVIAHRGRRTQQTYRTVVLAFRRRQTLVVALTYGETDWQRNVMAAGSAEVVRWGRTHQLKRPRLVASAEARQLPVGTRWTARVFGLALVTDIAGPASPDPASPDPGSRS